MCVDTSRGGGKRVRWEVDRFQLDGIPHAALDHVGRWVTAHGAIKQPTLGWHFTKLLLRVDSIPALRTRRQDASDASA